MGDCGIITNKGVRMNEDITYIKKYIKTFKKSLRKRLAF